MTLPVVLNNYLLFFCLVFVCLFVGAAPSENFYTPSTGSLIQTDSSQPDPVLSTHQLLSKIVEQDNHLDRQQKEIEKLHSKLDEDRGKEIQSLRGELRKKIDEVNSLCGQLAKLQEILWTKNDVPLYDMVRVPHGLAIVIANEKFDSDPQKPHVSLKQRKGAIKDAELFAQTFGFLNYKVKLHRDLSSDSMRSLVSRVANLDHSEFDSFVCCVSSHGNQTGIYGSNGVVLHRSLFIDPIKSNTSLLGKPKLFFFQACRVANVEVDSPELYPPDPIAPILHVDCDVLIANASTEGNPAYTSPASGSWFADALQQTLTNPQSVYSLTLQQMLEKVTNMISQAAGRLSGGEEVVKQCMEVTTRMRKGIKFFTSV